MAVPYPGNIPTNVNKDAKYSIVSGSDGYQVRLIVTLSAGVRELLTTDEHPELVEMVNEIKHQYNGAYGGEMPLVAGIPALLFGPAGSGAHAMEEWVDLDSVETCFRVYAEVIRTFCA